MFKIDLTKFKPMFVASVLSLIFTILNLRESLQDKEKAAEAIRRYAVNLEVPSEEVTMLKKMSHWPQMYIIEWKLLTYFFLLFSQLHHYV